MSSRFLSACFAVLLSACPALGNSRTEGNQLVVHEWGTFTSLQDETGRAIGGLNINDEPLPKFVHRLAGPTAPVDPAALSKGFATLHPEVTMRLETPVVYFYPPANGDKIPVVDVSVAFRGGLLSEFYPRGDAGPAGASAGTKDLGKINGTLGWKNVTIGAGGDRLPVTDLHVWLAPRLARHAAPLTVGAESEQYLFYRGVAQLDAPVRVVRSGGSGEQIRLFDGRPAKAQASPLKLRAMWLAEFRADGACAYRKIDAVPAAAEGNPVGQPASFTEGEFSVINVDKLRVEMHAALVADGLFDEEASAMLETWKLSYFKSVGQRLFFLVPRDWTDGVLPLTVSKPCDLTRVMMGRIELVTPAQRQSIKRLVENKNLTPPEAQALHAKLGRMAAPMLTDAMPKKPQATTTAAAAARTP